MTNDRLTQLIAAYGTQPSAWPEAERAQARAALAMRDLQAFEEDAALDVFLASAAPIVAAPDLVSRLMPQAPAPKPARWARLHAILFPNGQAWPAGMALASLCVGLLAGYSAPSTTPQMQPAEAYLLTAFDSEPLFEALQEETR